MAGFFSRVRESFRSVMLSPGAEDPYQNGDYYEEDDGYDYDDYEDEHVQMQTPRYEKSNQNIRRNSSNNPLPTGRTASRGSLSDKVIELGYTSGGERQMSESVIAHPTNINDAVELCNHVRSGRMVIVDLTSLDKLNAQRIADYLSGVCQSLDGDTKRVNNGIFTISPKNHRVTSDYREEIAYEGNFFPMTASDR